jgi:hypothetical protein
MKLALFASSLVCAVSLASVPEIVGQKAHYKLDKDPKRTSSLIKSGKVDVAVTQHIATASPPAYEVTLNYKFDIQLLGPQEGSQPETVDAEYFKPEFLENLRKTGQYEGINFKAKHQGYADAKNLDGKVYKNCDKILLYDFKDADYDDIQDLQVVAHIYPGVPVLGAVKIDASGKYNGMPVKVGGDFVVRKPNRKGRK